MFSQDRPFWFLTLQMEEGGKRRKGGKKGEEGGKRRGGRELEGAQRKEREEEK